RDIKPANILVTEYNRPALTDFGISVALVGGAGSEQESVGMSIPWSPPEVFGATPASGAAADIYSLGATVYTILAGRSPFEVPGGANGGLELIGRIQTAPLGRTGRADVPDSLEQVLATAMAKRESDRYASALEFARAMQKVQLELSLSVTPADVIDEQMAGDDFEEEDEGHTRIRGIVTIDPTAPPPTGSRRPAAPAAGTPPTGAPPTSPNGWRSSPFQDVDGATVRPDARTPSTSPGGGSDAGATGGGTAGGTGGVGTAANGWSSSGTREVDGAEAPSGGGTPSTPWGQQGARPGGASDDASTDGVRMRGDRDGAPATGRGAGGVEARDAFPVEETVHRAAVAPEQTATEAPRRRALPYLIGAAVVVLLAGTGALVFALNGGGSPAEQSAVETDRPVDQVDVGNASVPAPIDLVGTANADGTAIAFSWKNPDPREGDTFRWATVANGSTGQEQRIDEATVTVPTEGAAEVCIQVSLVRTDGKGSDPIAGCAP
ncbi:MAG: protein kinase, partial [Herbiconiux sp.]|nr:protein kinase [Herbiconiux sp.]